MQEEEENKEPVIAQEIFHMVTHVQAVKIANTVGMMNYMYTGCSSP